MEQTYNLDPLDPFDNNGANGDPDGDGVCNLMEYAFDLSPEIVDRKVLVPLSFGVPEDRYLHGPEILARDRDHAVLARNDLAGLIRAAVAVEADGYSRLTHDSLFPFTQGYTITGKERS